MEKSRAPGGACGLRCVQRVRTISRPLPSRLRVSRAGVLFYVSLSQLSHESVRHRTPLTPGWNLTLFRKPATERGRSCRVVNSWFPAMPPTHRAHAKRNIQPQCRRANPNIHPHYEPVRCMHQHRNQPSRELIVRGFCCHELPGCRS